MPLPYDHPALFGAGPRGAWLALRALHVASTEQGWVRYVTCQDRMKGAHVLDIRQGDGEKLPHHRVVFRAEVWWWTLGLADGRRVGTVLDPLLSERVPKLLTAEETAARLGITEAGVRYHNKADTWYPIYVVDEEDHRVRRHVFASQLSGRGWQETRTLLPDQPRPGQLAEQVTPRPSPHPLPVAGLPSPLRQRDALALAVELGWVSSFVSQPDRFLVRLPRKGGERQVPVRGVEAYLLGLGDGHEGQGQRVAYREGLG